MRWREILDWTPPRLGVCLLSFLAACAGTSDQVAVPTKTAGDGDQEARGPTLKEFARSGVLLVENAASRIAAGTDDVRIKRRTVEWKISSFLSFLDIVQMEDVQLATLDTWVTTLQWRDFFSTGAGKDHFGEGQPIAVEACTRVAESFDNTIRQNATPEAYEKAKAGVEAFARDHPMKGVTRQPYRISESPKIKLSFDWVKDLAMPWQLSSGVVDMADAVNEVAQAGERFTIAMTALPFISRWQVELLLYDLDENASVTQALEDFSRLSASIEEISETADKLPEEVREQLSITLKEAEEAQVGLRQTLEEARLTVTETRAALGDFNSALDNAEGTVGSLEKITSEFARAADVWDPTFKTFRGVIDDLEGDPNSPPREGPGTLEELRRIAEGLGLSAVELQKLLADLRETIAGEDLEKGFGRMAETARGTVDHARTQMDEVVDHAAWRLTQLVVVILLSALLYRFVAPRLDSRKKRNGEKPA